LFRRFLESYIKVCNDIVTESANSVLMFEAGETAARMIETTKIDDIAAEFEKEGLKVVIDISEKKVVFHLKGIACNKECNYCDILRGFFGAMARKHINPGYYCKKGTKCAIQGSDECTFVAEQVG